MKFKILFPGGYSVENIVNDDTDVNIVLENGEVYYCWLFTTAKVQSWLINGTEPYVWATNMIVVSDLSKLTIRRVIERLVANEEYLSACSKIGTIGIGDHDYYASYDAVEDMCLQRLSIV